MIIFRVTHVHVLLDPCIIWSRTLIQNTIPRLIFCKIYTYLPVYCYYSTIVFSFKKTWLSTSPCVPVYRSSLSQSRYARACTGGLLCLQRKKLQAFSPSNQSSFLTTINLACGTPHAAGRAPEELINPWRKKGCDRQKTERGEYSCIIIPLPLLLLFSFALAGGVLLGWTHLLLHRSPSPTDQLSPPS